MRIVMSGGGTAGHIYPALTVAELLAAEGAPDEILFVGTPDGVEASLVPEAKIRFFGLRAAGYDRSRPFTLLTSGIMILFSTLRAWALLRRERPDVVVGFGGYVSLPVGLAAVVTRTPLVLHEQNSVPGMANRVLSRWATAVALTYEASLEYLSHPDRARVTGNPVRCSVLAADRERGRKTFGFTDEIVVLAFGGSRGARHINRALVENACTVLRHPAAAIVHIAGRAETGSVTQAAADSGIDLERYRILDYVDDMGSAIAASDIVVSRAGATSIAEITAIGRAAVLVPYPYATDDHQTKNARALVDAGGALLVPDGDLDSELFVSAVTGLLESSEARANMAAASRRMGHPDAAIDVLDLVRGASGIPADEPKEIDE